MKSYFFRLSLPYHECENLYRPSIPTVLITAETGERVQIPTKNLRPFVGREGLSGRFRLLINSENKIKSFEKVS